MATVELSLPLKKLPAFVPAELSRRPNLSFTVPDNKDIFHYNSTSKKVARIAWIIFSIIIFPVGIIQLIGKGINRLITRNMILPGINHSKVRLDEVRNTFMYAFPERGERITIKTADHNKLDAMIVKNLNQAERPIENKKFIIFLNGNGGTYEHALLDLMQISNETGADVLCGNYRGIGYSEGFPGGYKDLLMDGETQIQYLLNLGVNPKNILIHGWSLGGGVGAHLAVHHQQQGKEVSFCNDRSFASMVDEVKAISQNMKTSLRANPNCLTNFIVHLISAFTFVAIGLIRANWNFQSLECYKKIQGYKFLIYHQNDRVIPHSASLFKKLMDEQQIVQGRQQERINAIRLSDDIEADVAHGIPLPQTPQFREYVTQTLIATSG